MRKIFKLSTHRQDRGTGDAKPKGKLDPGAGNDHRPHTTQGTRQAQKAELLS